MIIKFNLKKSNKMYTTLFISLFFISTAILQGWHTVREEKIKVPDSNIILDTLESSLANYQRENNRLKWHLINPSDFSDIAQILTNKANNFANRTLAISYADDLITSHLKQKYRDRWNILQTQNYIIAILSKYRIT